MYASKDSGLAERAGVLWSLRSGDLFPFVLSLSLFFSPVSVSWCLLPTSAQVVAHLFSSHAPQAAPQRLGKSSSVTRLYKAHTVAAKFQQSLLDLVEKMER